MKLLLRTTHGSRLYGTFTPESDYDWYEVWSGGPRRAKQLQDGDLDTVKVPLTEFMRQCTIGVPQALEAMYSPVAEVDVWPLWRGSWHTGQDAQWRFLRTIKQFSILDRYEGLKEPRKLMKRRHSAVRLSLYMEQINSTGRFNPMLSVSDKEHIREIMQSKETYYNYITQFGIDYAPGEVDEATYYPELAEGVQGLTTKTNSGKVVE